MGKFWGVKMKIKKVAFKVKIWDEFGRPVDKIKGSKKDINTRMKKIFKKYA